MHIEVGEQAGQWGSHRRQSQHAESQLQADHRLESGTSAMRQTMSYRELGKACMVATCVIPCHWCTEACGL